VGCRGGGAQELKDHPFFEGIDWQQVYLQKYPPPLIPPRGEVNAADAFDIGSFDEEDTKGIKLTESDQDLYKNFPLTVSERWQQEIAETVFDAVNQEADKVEMKRRQKQSDGLEANFGPTDCIVEGEVLKLGGPFLQTWQKKHLKLYPNRLEFYPKRDGHVIRGKGVELIPMTDIQEVIPDFQKLNKSENCIVLHMKNETKIAITSPDRVLINQWKDEMINGFRLSSQIMANMNKKVRSKYGAETAAAAAAAALVDGGMTHHSLEKCNSEES
jgi:beta-adrenergic-receptor kinase